MIYGYGRVSTDHQDLTRQIKKIREAYPDAEIYADKHTGTEAAENRVNWEKLCKKLKKGDTVVFDEVSRLSRNADDGVKIYKSLYESGVEIIFLKSRDAHLNTEMYKKALSKKIELTGTSFDCIIQGINQYFMVLAEEQIKLAFAQAEAEAIGNRERIKEGQAVAKANGKHIGLQKGTKLTTKKSIGAKETILKHSKDFKGTLTDSEVIKLAGISRNSFYKYKAEIKAELNAADNG